MVQMILFFSCPIFSTIQTHNNSAVQEKEGPLGQEEFQDEEDDDQDQTEEEPQLKEESEVGKVPGESERQRAFEIASEVPYFLFLSYDSFIS